MKYCDSGLNLTPVGAYQALTGVSAATALRDLRALVDLGILEQVSPSKKKARYILRERPS